MANNSTPAVAEKGAPAVFRIIHNFSQTRESRFEQHRPQLLGESGALERGTDQAAHSHPRSFRGLKHDVAGESLRYLHVHVPRAAALPLNIPDTAPPAILH